MIDEFSVWASVTCGDTRLSTSPNGWRRTSTSSTRLPTFSSAVSNVSRPSAPSASTSLPKTRTVVRWSSRTSSSNHDHLGKLLTYLVGIEARKAIWIVADPRPEHMGVVTW